MNINALKQLESQVTRIDKSLEKYKGEKTILKEEEKTLNNNISELEQKKKRIQTRINKEHEKRKTKKVSDHARVRFLEKVLGMDMDDIDKEILSEDKCVIKSTNGVVTTCWAKEGHSPHD